MPLALEPDATERHRSVPIRDTITRIPGYPRKLVIFQIPASSYWWVRYFTNHRMFKRTTKTEVKLHAIEAAKRFYDEINFRIHSGIVDRPMTYNPAEVFTFNKVARMLVESEEAKFKRGQLTKMSFDNMQLRLNKLVLPYFGEIDINSINYRILEGFLQELSKQPVKLSVSTISAYMGLVRKVLQHGARQSLLQHMPEFPKVGTEDKPRGWFTVKEYRVINAMAKRLVGKRVEWRAPHDGGESYFCLPGDERDGRDRLIRRLEMTADLPDVIVFMVNSYVRPTDIKNMQHRHVDVVKREFNYLRLNLPPSKGHSYPITTMPWAVKVYERVCQRRLKEKGQGEELHLDEHVFMPAAKTRDDAMKKLQRQFEVVLNITGLRLSNTGVAGVNYLER